MNRFGPGQLRNVALVAHGGAGKTSLAEAALLRAGVGKRLGSVVEGTSVSDWDPEEVKRKISLNTSVVPLEWEGRKLNLLDTPGYFDFVGEVKAGLRVADGAVVVVCAAAGCEVGTEQVWAYAQERALPRLVFMNKLERENADFERTLGELRQAFGPQVVAVQMPIGQAQAFEGIVDLLELQAWKLDGGQPQPVALEGEPAEAARALREQLVEAVAATDDALTEKYLAEESLSAEEIRSALTRAVPRGELSPVLCGSALTGAGVSELLSAIVAWLPSPEGAGQVEASTVGGGDRVSLRPEPQGPLAALVFKTISDPYVGRLNLLRVYSGELRSDSTALNAARGREERIGQLFVVRGKEQIPVAALGPGDIGGVAKLQETVTGDTLTARDRPVLLEAIDFPRPAFTLALQPRAKGDEDKISSSLARLVEEDPTFKVEKNAETGELLVSGLGELHLEVVASRLQRKFGVGVDLAPPRVPYRETIRKKVQVEGKHKKQTGGRGQYGHVFLELEPAEPGTGFEFVDKIFGGAVPRNYIPAVEKGVRETMAGGVLAGYPVVDVRVTLYDGSYHPVDSSEMAFKVAASMAFKKGFMEAEPVLLEPVMGVEVRVPETFMGDVIGDLNKKRGRILGMDSDRGWQVIRAQVPLAEMFRYAVDLRSITQGRGSFAMEFDHYQEVPAQQAEEVIGTARAGRAG